MVLRAPSSRRRETTTATSAERILPYQRRSRPRSRWDTDQHDSGGFVETGRLLLTDKVTVILEKGKDGKFEAKTQSWDLNETFLPGEQLRVEVVSFDFDPTQTRDELYGLDKR
jgi:hypothetical protein